MSVKLSREIIQTAKPRAKTYTLWDTDIKGFGARIYPSGTKSFVLAYRPYPGGRSTPKKTAKLARTNEISLRKARRIATDELLAARCGKPHILERRQAICNASPSVSDGLDRYFLENVLQAVANGDLTPAELRQFRNHAELVVRPELGSVRVSEVTRTDVESTVVSCPTTTRNQALKFIANLFSFFEECKWRPPRSNPCDRIPSTREGPHCRPLMDDQLVALGTSLNTMQQRDPVSFAAIQFACLTGLRFGEILPMQWNQVDFDTDRLRLSNFGSGDRWEEFPSFVLRILSTLPRVNQWVFTADSGPLSYTQLHDFLKRCAADASISDVRLDDLRATVIAIATAQGVSPDVRRLMFGP